MKKAIDKTVLIARSYREAPLRPDSIDVTGRTVDVVWATETPVLRFWENDEPYWEVLSLNPDHIVLERFSKGLSVLDAHNRQSTKSIYGLATDPEFPEGQALSVCKARFSKNNEDAVRVFKDIEDGIIRFWSFGYDVLRMLKTGAELDGIPVCLATLWEPFELSVVPVGADPNAGMRSKSMKLHSCEIINFRGVNMKNKKNGNGDADRNEDEEEDEKSEEEEKNKSSKKESGKEPDEEEKSRAATDEERAKTMSTESRTAARAIAEERRRINEIRSAYTAMPTVLDESSMQAFIDDGSSADDFRKALIDAAREKQPVVKSGSSFEMGREAVEKKRELMVLAILHRSAPDRYPLKDEKTRHAREFRSFNLIDMAKESLDDQGVKHRGMSPREIAELAMGTGSQRGMHATNDFPILLSDTINKSLRDCQELAQPTYPAFCRRSSVKDFREKHLLQVGDVSKFQKILEGGEYKAGTIGESKESYRVHKYGNRISLTWEAIINDDLDAFNRIPVSIIEESIQICSDIVYGILLSNPKMGDGKPLFDAAHQNIGNPADIDLEGMDEAFTAIGTQKNANGRLLNLHPEFLIFGHSKRTKALQYLNDTVVPNKADDVVPAQMRGLAPIVEGRISGNQWFLACKPGRIDTIEYAYLEGEEGLFTEERWGFEVDGLEIKARLVFGAKAIDWRGLYKNPGA